MNVSIKVFLLLMLPALAFSQRSVSISTTNGKTKMQVSTNGNKFSLEYEGDIELTDDDKDVLSISKGGYFEVKKSAFGSRRRVFIEPENGSLVRKYYVGSKETDFDPEGKQWLAEILLEVLRNSSLGAEKRVKRMYENGGVSSVLKEVDEMDSDHVKAIYLKLLTKEDLNSEEVVQVLGRVNNVHSDHHRADILKGSMHEKLLDEVSIQTYINTVGGINSDHHKADVLKLLITSNDISDPQLASLFSITEGIDSDHHKADILIKLMDDEEIDSRDLDLLIGTMNEIDSDHHKANILKRAAGVSGLESNGYQIFLNSVSGIDSDHHKADVLENLLDEELLSTNLSDINVLVGRDINSDHHKVEVLRKIIREHDIDDKNIETLIRSISTIDSDHHAAEVFNELSLVELNENQLIRTFQALPLVLSQFSMEDALISFVPQVREGTNKTKDAFKESVKYLDSNSGQERLLRLIK